MRVSVDMRSKVPIQAQLVEQLQRLIASGELAPGMQLPTVRQLAADLRVNFNTVARAYRVLAEAGLITTRQGRGTYVVEPPTDRGERLRQAVLTSLVGAMLSEAARLGFDAEAVAVEIERLRRTEAGATHCAARPSAPAHREETKQ